MTLLLYGTIDEKGCDGINCGGCEYALAERDIGACRLEGMSSHPGLGSSVCYAIRLWKLLDRENEPLARVEEQLSGFVRGSIDSDDGTPRILKREWMDIIITEIEPLEDLLKAKYGEEMNCDPATVSCFEHIQTPVSHSIDGKTDHTLLYVWRKVDWLARFLRGAIELGRDVEWD